MEHDRFKMSGKLYILGMVCLVLSLGFFFLSLYILPYLIWQLNYKMPAFVLNLLAKLEDNYNYSVAASRFIVWFIFFIISLITGFVSYFVSNRIDSQIYNVETQTPEFEEQLPPKEIGKEIKESASFGLKILGLMVLIVIIILLLQFVIQFTV